jgi:uncharacterized ion transporter superfamily protein YfcC
VEWLADRLQNRERLIIPISCAVFALGGAVEGMYEEIIALVPVLLVLTRRVGFDAVTALGMSVGAASVGSGFSPINPFGVGIAQRLAELPLMSGWPFRVAVLMPALAIWTWGTLRTPSVRVRRPRCRSARTMFRSNGGTCSRSWRWSCPSSC